MNKYAGGSFEDFLKEEGIFEEVTERALKRLLALEIEDMVNTADRNRINSTETISTDLVRLNHYLFDIDNTVVTSELLDNLILEATEMKTNPGQLNDPLFDSEELLNCFLTDEIAA